MDTDQLAEFIDQGKWYVFSGAAVGVCSSLIAADAHNAFRHPLLDAGLAVVAGLSLLPSFSSEARHIAENVIAKLPKRGAKLETGPKLENN